MIIEITFILSSFGIIYKMLTEQVIFYIQYLLILNLLIFIISLFKIKTNHKYLNKKLNGGEKFTVKNKNKNKLLDLCNLPNDLSTNHCFSDSTHHTCCVLGKKAREYADKTGNPIGKASITAKELKTGKKFKKGKTSWCTCTGSEVCSYYADKFNDGTHIKFINDPNSNNIARKPLNLTEKEIKKRFNIGSHRTPGIYN